MSRQKIYLAADLGAGSGRVMAGLYTDGKLSLEEVHRFNNQPVLLHGHWHWNTVQLFSNIKEGITLAAKKYGSNALTSIGVDTWGVDHALLDGNDRLLGLPYCYRDSRTDEMISKADAIMSSQDRFTEAGIQMMHFNTLYQLLAEKDHPSSILPHSARLLFTPDLMNFWLSGVAVNESTIASTGELLEASSGQWSDTIIERYGLPRRIFGDLVEPGRILGPLLGDICEETGASSLNVVTVPSHDTAAAVAACPMSSQQSAYISSGTWSLIGMELSEPMTGAEVLSESLTNERGVDGTIRLLKNVSGFWILQQALNDWKAAGLKGNVDELREAARLEPAFQAFINPNHPSFEKPGAMLPRIAEYLKMTGQPEIEKPAAICRLIFEGLALSYQDVWNRLKRVTGRKLDTLHIIGGGSRNSLLNQYSADALGAKVVAGPVEASSIGNILLQLEADGEIESLTEGRELVKASFETTTYEPVDQRLWLEAGERFR